MKSFSYEGAFGDGATIRGVIEADDHTQAAGQIAQMDLSGVTIEEVPAPSPTKPVSTDDFVFFNEQLASLVEAGIPLEEGLRELGEEMQSPRLRRVVQAIADDLSRGLPLDEALTAQERNLPVLYGRVVRAGIKRGQLAATLLNLSAHHRLVSETRRIVIEAVVYPITVMIGGLALLSFVMLYMVPSFRDLFADFDSALPAITRFLIDCSSIYPAFLGLLGFAVVATCVSWTTLRRSEKGRRLRERIVLAIPAIGNVVRTSLAARFLRGVAFSVNSGLTLPESVRLAAESTGSPILLAEGDQIARSLENGESIRTACSFAHVVPRAFGYVAQIAMDRNTLGDSAQQMARAYESRTNVSQSLLREWLVPIAIIFGGAIGGVCILALFLPILSLIRSVAG
jgi:type IV pilus assembly protein PilC